MQILVAYTAMFNPGSMGRLFSGGTCRAARVSPMIPTIEDTDLARMRQRLQITRLHLLEADRRCEAMRRSRSWHITAPLRAAARFAPGPAHLLWMVIKAVVWTLKGDLPCRIRGWKRARQQGAATAQAGNVDPPEVDREIIRHAIATSQTQSSILVADWSLPNPERGAGNRICLQILKTLAGHGFRVLFWPEDRTDDPPTRQALEALGVVVLGLGDTPDLGGWLACNGHTLHHVLLARPFLARTWLPTVLRYSNAYIAYFGHDLHHARLRDEAALTDDLDLANRADRMLAIEREVWRLVDVVLYPSDEETARVRLLEPLVTARTLTPYAFDNFTTRLHTPVGNDLLFVGGYAHRPNQDAALWLVNEILPPIRAAVPNARLILAGSDPTPAIIALAGESIVVTGRISDEVLLDLYASSRLVLAPLRFGAGVKGKVVEALSSGVPLVTTRTGAQGLPGLEDVVPVFDDPRRIVEAAVRLLGDDAAWVAQSKAQVRYARKHFSTAAFEASLMAAFSA